MSLPDTLDSRDLRESCVTIFFVRCCLRSRRCSRPDRRVDLPEALSRPIVHDSNLRADRIEQSRRSRSVKGPVTACLIDRHRTELVDRAHELHLLCPVEINQGEEIESAEREQRADHVLILGARGSLLFRARAARILPAAATRLCERLSSD